MSKAVSNFLKSKATVKEKKEYTKSESLVCEEFQNKADTVSKAYDDYKKAETLFREKEASLLSEAQKLYESNAVSGEFYKSIDFIGDKTTGVQVVWQDKFSLIPVDNESSLKESLGSNYKKYFEEQRVITLDNTSDAAIKLLLSKLGKEDFEKLFSVKVSIKAKPGMDKEQFSLPDTIRGMLKQNKPGLKPISKKVDEA